MNHQPRTYHLTFTDLAPMDIAIYYLGAVQRLRDAQERQASPRSKRGNSPGGRVQLASDSLSLTEKRLRQLAKNDPDKARSVCEWMRTFIDPSAVAMADGLERELERART